VKISYPGFWKKLSNFEEYGLIKSYKYKIGQNGTTIKYFRLKEKGYNLIKKIEDVPKHYESEDITDIPKNNLDHHFGTKEVILKSLIALKEKNITGFRVVPSKNTRVYPVVIPDGVMQLDDKYIYIEFDSCSESLKELK
jgi:Replication-relaxation